MTVHYNEHQDRLEEYSNHSTVESLAKLIGLLIQKDILTFEEGMYIIQDSDVDLGEGWRKKQVEDHIEKLVFGMLSPLKK